MRTFCATVYELCVRINSIYPFIIINNIQLNPRQVIALLRRILPEVRPQTLAGLLGIAQLPPKDFGILARSSSEAVTPNDIGILGMKIYHILFVIWSFQWNEILSEYVYSRVSNISVALLLFLGSFFFQHF